MQLHLVVRESFQYREFRGAVRLHHVRGRTRAGEAAADIVVVELDRRQPRVDGVGRHGRSGLCIEAGILAPEVAGAAGDRIGRIARDAGLFRDAVAGHIVPDIVCSEVAAELELAALACIQRIPVALQRRAHESGEDRQVARIRRIGAVSGRQYAVEHRWGNPWQLGPVPVGHGELRITTERADGLFEVADIAPVPDVEPPVAVRAVHQVHEGVAEPVAWIVCRQCQHGLDAACIAGQHALAFGAGDVVAVVACLRGLSGRCGAAGPGPGCYQ